MVKIAGEVLPKVLSSVLAAAIPGPLSLLVNPCMEEVFKDFYCRMISTRQKSRIYSMMEKFEEFYASKIKQGLKLRTDNFWITDVSGNSHAANICEAVLCSVMNDYNKNKEALYARLLANLAFSDIEYNDAIFLIKIYETMTWRQVLILAFFNINNYRQIDRGFYFSEFNNLVQSNVIELFDRNFQYKIKARLSDDGRKLVTLLELDSIDQTDIDNLIHGYCFD